MLGFIQKFITKEIIFFFFLFFMPDFCFSQEGKIISSNQNPPTEYIRWIRQIPSSEKGKTKTFKIWIYQFLFGENPPLLSKPISISYADPDKLWIVDQGNSSVLNILENNNKITKHNNKDYTSLVGICVTPGKDILFTDSRLNKIFKIKSGQKKPEVLNDSLILSQPTGIAYSNVTHEIWVVESNMHRISVLNNKGKLIKTIGKRGIAAGEFNFPTSIWIDNKGLAYIVDAMNFRIQIFDKNGTFKSMFGKAGNGTGYFARPKGIATDSFGNIYITDALFNTVQIFDKNGKFLFNFGKYGTGQSEFSMPTGIYIDNNNYIYVADSFNSRIQVFKLINGNQ